MPRNRGRHHPLPRRIRQGAWLGQGKQVVDAVTGIPVPLKLTVVQNGKRVSRKISDGGWDKPDRW